MKTLYIVRHAKSSWDNPLQDDFDRPLNDRGKKDSPRMGRRLKEQKIFPALMLSSPAHRALSTCKRIAEVLHFPGEKIKTAQELYHASAAEILEVVRNVEDQHESLMIFGHNPGLTDFANALMQNEEDSIDNIPTCGIVAFSIKTESWQKVRFGDSDFLFFDFPKSKND
jgi:phosphohistidine phosphatase